MTRCRTGKRGRGVRGFTLIELLVVVAIIALLISILLPSLSKAREQARTTLCASRISQITKAMLIYADDFAESPPFIIRDADSDDPYDNGGENRRLETWLAAASTMQRIYDLPEEDWYTLDDPRLPESGDLFTYSRFPALYVCPEFQRLNHSLKDQNTFNYTRDILGRRIDISDPLNPKVTDLLKISAVYSTSQLPMMMDEAWNCCVALPLVNKGWVWGGHDPMLDLLNSCLGQYHGPPKPGWVWFPESDPPGAVNRSLPDYQIKLATVCYYDGHAGLMRDPVPNMDYAGGRAPLGDGLGTFLNSYLYWISNLIFAQQGNTWSP
ncbi:MAG: prepilin-type N-terminal cleavage/methylation domain-containing protein [Phycisphaerae bacterium]|nr:prepilin-type N-terminal cleavage/methylation domain-containing protein [Phycisphaerae bacterium]